MSIGREELLLMIIFWEVVGNFGLGLGVLLGGREENSWWWREEKYGEGDGREGGGEKRGLMVLKEGEWEKKRRGRVEKWWCVEEVCK